MTLTEEQAKQLKKQLLTQIKKLPKEQVGGLKEQIEEASPEELEEFIKSQQEAAQGQGSKCIFCEIIAGRMETVKVYEDQDILVVMEIMPASQGHILIMPKEHYQFLQELPEKVLQKIFYFVKIMPPVLIKILDAKALSIYIPQGVLAGQRIQHFVVNLIPRYEHDQLAFDWEHNKAEIKDLEKVAEKIRKASQTEVVKGLSEEKEKYEKKKKEHQESEAEKILKHISKRMP